MKILTSGLVAMMLLQPALAHAQGNGPKMKPAAPPQGTLFCPPGLAKKNNGCVPPGQLKHRYERGERIRGDYVVIRDPSRYRLEPGYEYWSSEGYVYRVDRQTGKVLNFIGAAAALLE